MVGAVVQPKDVAGYCCCPIADVMADYSVEQVSDYLWEIPRQKGMQVPARLYASEELIDDILSDQAPQQTVNVAYMPGIVKASMAMPDIHWGYGFPIGGVAAFDEQTGVVSPGGVGYDINCGVRLMASELTHKDLNVKSRKQAVVDELFRRVPTGVGAAGALKVSKEELRQVLVKGAKWATDQGFQEKGDLAFIEEGGCMKGADPEAVSERALQRGTTQLGTLGSGNHFLEFGYVAEIYNAQLAQQLGLFKDQITVIIHSGSRGFGYQVCDDYLKVMDKAMNAYGIDLPDRQLACAPLTSSEGQQYLKAMNCAINYAFANRQVMASNVRKAFMHALDASPADIGLRTVYEVAHNIAKFETHTVDGTQRRLCVHRKGATRALPPGHSQVPTPYQAVGQPVLIPGDMGRYSYVLVGTEKALQETFGSTCHGAGRRMSRRQAKKVSRGRHIARELEDQGIIVRSESSRTIREEIPEAYKDVTNVVDACERAGISTKVVQLRPLGCIKG